MWGVIYKYTMLPAFIGGLSRSFGASSDELLYLDMSILGLQKSESNSVTENNLKNFRRENFFLIKVNWTSDILRYSGALKAS